LTRLDTFFYRLKPHPSSSTHAYMPEITVLFKAITADHLNTNTQSPMKMHYMYAIKSILLTSCLFISALSCAQQPPTTKPKPTDALGPQAAAAKCPAVGEVLKLLGQKKLFEQTAESFLPTVAEQLKLTKDETISLSASEKSRTLNFAPVNKICNNQEIAVEAHILNHR
jgi:hypothetical protein